MPHTINQSIESLAVTSQPAIYAVAGATFAGITLEDWVLIGTGVLVTLNIGLAIHKIYSAWREK